MLMNKQKVKISEVMSDFQTEPSYFMTIIKLHLKQNSEQIKEQRIRFKMFLSHTTPGELHSTGYDRFRLHQQ